jgi:cellulose synthase/poly-beta-1,6-N-acetylglucosamine synthase-like glycosyltransferase
MSEWAVGSGQRAVARPERAGDGQPVAEPSTAHGPRPHAGWPTVAVVVPVYNAIATIGPLIESLRRLDYPADRLSITLVDNGSKDGTVAFIERQLMKVDGHPIRLIHEHATRGPAPARNAGIRATRSELLAFTDSDCIVTPGWLKALVAPFLSDPTIGGVAGEVEGAPPESPVERYCADRRVLSQAVGLRHPYLPYTPTPNCAFRRAVFEQIGLFDETMICGEDVDFSWRMQERSTWRLAFHPEALVYHKFRSDTRSFFVQARKWGYGAVFVMVRHGVPMRREELPRRLAEYRGLAKAGLLLPWYWLQARRGALDLAEWEQRYLDWLYRFGLKLGRLRAAVEFRRLYL